MLPTSKEYFSRAGFSTNTAAYLLIGLFLAGVVVIQFVSSFIHRHIPSHIVDCAHTHGKDVESGGRATNSSRRATISSSGITENSPLLADDTSSPLSPQEASLEENRRRTRRDLEPSSKAALGFGLSCRISSFFSSTKRFCDDAGPCYGLSQTCGQECVKTIQRDGIPDPSSIVQDGLPRRNSSDAIPRLAEESGVADVEPRITSTNEAIPKHSEPSLTVPHSDSRGDTLHADHPALDMSDSVGDFEVGPGAAGRASTEVDASKALLQHHHHVPQNAFLSIGLQTSLAIALHKLPEGFITYATNYTNPTLGFSVFMALFIHNITEGFAMALPLYLALHSRIKAMFYSSLLGGISQPAGAGIAALWIWSTKRAHDPANELPDGPSWAVYGAMFAATAGVMTCVALQLFSESLGLTHNRSLCIGFTIFGMVILGLSSALTA